VDRHDFLASTLGLPSFPTGSGLPSPLDGTHVMGVVVMAWLTQFPVARWGEAWLHRGTMRIRHRAHLDLGTPVGLVVDETPGELALDVVGADGAWYADGAAGLEPAGAVPGLAAPPPAPDRPACRPDPDALRGRRLADHSFDFDAGRDLAFLDELPDGQWWQQRAWAHPSWLATGVNAMLLRSIDFAGTAGPDGPFDHWRHAGTALRLVEPIPSGATVTLRGSIEDLFDSVRFHFAVARVSVLAGDEPAGLIRTTFVYGTMTDAPGSTDDEP
jgi:hypothetical protein